MSLTKIYCIRFCLSGKCKITEHEAEIVSEQSTEYARVKEFSGTLLDRRNYGLTIQEAQIMANTKRNKKIASLKKQIEKLQSLTF